MTRVTSEHIDHAYDAFTMVRIAAQALSHGRVDAQLAGDLSWMLGSVNRRMEPILGLLEQAEAEGGDPRAEDLKELRAQGSANETV